MLRPEPFGARDRGFDRWDVWQGDGLDWWPKDDEDKYDDNKAGPVTICWDATTTTEDEAHIAMTKRVMEMRTT